MTLEQARELLALHDAATEARGKHHAHPTAAAWGAVMDADKAFRVRLFELVDWKAEQ